MGHVICISVRHTNGNAKLAFRHVGLEFRVEVWDAAIKMGESSHYIIIWRKIEKRKSPRTENRAC